MAFAIQKSWHDKYELARASMRRVAEKAKQSTHLAGEVVFGAAAAGTLGALDQAKGVSKPNDYGFSQHYVGPVPTSALVGGVALLGALALPFNSMESKVALGVAQGGIDAAAYVAGRRAWAKHAQNNGGK